MKIKKLASVAIALSVLLGGNSALAASSDSPVKIASANFEYSETATEALNHLNDIRKKMGLQEVKLNPYLTKAAENHAKYLSINGASTGHKENSNDKGFTGETVRDRVTAVGGSSDLSYMATDDISYSERTATKSIDLFIDSAYHRRPIVKPTLLEVGAAISGSNFVLVFGTEDNTRKETSLYPYDGQVDTKIGFYGFENPNPLTQFGLSKSGYIISFYVPYVLDTEEIKATIKNSKGVVLPHFSEWDTGLWYFFPKTELAYNETYTVSVDYVPQNGTEKGKQLNKTWSFTTMAKPSGTTPTTPTTPGTGGYVKPDPSGTIPAVKFNKDNVGVEINGAMVTLTPQAMIVDGSTFIPLRGVFEKLDSEVKWNNEDRSVTITRGATTVKLTINSKTAYINGKAITLSIAPFIAKSGSTYVPLRFASESIGAEVGWDQTSYIAKIKAE